MAEVLVPCWNEMHIHTYISESLQLQSLCVRAYCKCFLGQCLSMQIKLRTLNLVRDKTWGGYYFSPSNCYQLCLIPSQSAPITSSPFSFKSLISGRYTFHHIQVLLFITSAWFKAFLLQPCGAPALLQLASGSPLSILPREDGEGKHWHRQQSTLLGLPSLGQWLLAVLAVVGEAGWLASV